jgi:hypothetical protein
MIKNYEQFILEENIFRKGIITLGTLLGLGLSEMDAPLLKNNQRALSVIDACKSYNKLVSTNPNSKIQLNNFLDTKIENADFFINNYIEFLPDKTIIIKPDFIKGIDLNYNPKSREMGIHYKIEF